MPAKVDWLQLNVSVPSLSAAAASSFSVGLIAWADAAELPATARAAAMTMVVNRPRTIGFNTGSQFRSSPGFARDDEHQSSNIVIQTLSNAIIHEPAPTDAPARRGRL